MMPAPVYLGQDGKPLPPVPEAFGSVDLHKVMDLLARRSGKPLGEIEEGYRTMMNAGIDFAYLAAHQQPQQRTPDFPLGPGVAAEILDAAKRRLHPELPQPERIQVEPKHWIGAQMMDQEWLVHGRVRPLPASIYLSEDPMTLKVWCHSRARYTLPTVELLTWLTARIAGRTAIEIGAGNGDLGYLLGIPRTDSYFQTTPESIIHYDQFNAPTRPTPDVVRLDATNAVAKYRPRVVVGSWITRLFREGCDTKHSQASHCGVDEEALLSSVETYIHIGATHIHGQKTLLARPHDEVQWEGLVSRVSDQSANIIYVWENPDYRGETLFI